MKRNIKKSNIDKSQVIIVDVELKKVFVRFSI